MGNETSIYVAKYPSEVKAIKCDMSSDESITEFVAFILGIGSSLHKFSINVTTFKFEIFVLKHASEVLETCSKRVTGESGHWLTIVSKHDVRVFSDDSFMELYHKGDS